MNPEIVGRIAAGITIVNAIPYLVRVYQGKIKPSVTSWSLWTLIGLALLLTYHGQGAKANLWPVMLAFINPLLVTILALKKRGEWSPLTKIEIVSIAVASVALLMWLFVHNDVAQMQYALYLSIVADACAALPTIILVWGNPLEDRPFCWIVFVLAYALNLFAITEHTVANYILPLWFVLGGSVVALPLTLYRIKHKIPFKEWI